MRYTTLGVRNRLTGLLIGGAALAGLPAASVGAIDLLTEDFTTVYVEGYLPYKTSSLTSPHLSVGSETNVGASTSFSFTAHNPAGWPIAELDSFGFSSLGGPMGARLNLSGPAAIQASISTRFHDAFVVDPPPGVAQGTPGVMTFVYHADGVGDVIGLPGETVDDEFTVAAINLVMWKYTSDGNTPPAPIIEPLGAQSREIISSNALGGGAVNAVDFTFGEYFSFDIPFEYGVPLSLQTQFRIVVFTDNRFFRALFNPYRELWGGGVVQNIFVDSTSTSRLVAIVNAAHPTATITGVSTDYSALVTDEFVAIEDEDDDGVADADDNCVLVPNPDQADANGADDDDPSLAGIQHYGDVCDPDLDDDGIVAASDFFGTFLPCLGALAAEPQCAVADLDGDGIVSSGDFFGVMRPYLGGPPGPGMTE